VLVEEHGYAVRLLAAGAPGAPELEPLAGAPVREELRQHEPAQGLERIVVPEERGLVRQEGVDDLLVQGGERRLPEAGDQLGDGSGAGLGRERRQAGFNEPLRSALELDARVAADQVPHELEGVVVRAERGGRGQVLPLR
jgi:hypothetical protein